MYYNLSDSCRESFAYAMKGHFSCSFSCVSMVLNMQAISKPNLNFFEKSNHAISSAVKNTSCSRGWLRLLVQTVFCIITVASFILILAMSMQRSPYADKHKPENSQKCVVSNCRVICSNALFDREYEDEINYAISTLTCKNIFLTLNRPDFVNRSLPSNWLSRIGMNINELDIVGGNLKYIPPNTFMSSFTSNIETLVLEDITISDWSPDMLVGLLQLKNLNIRDCRIMNIQRNALRAVDETLQSISIRTSGLFNPENLTGSSHLTQLTEVDFTADNFSDFLGPKSFRELIFCKILSLTSSRITAIHEGAFEAMVSLEMLYLNNNKLKTLPTGIFDRLVMRQSPNIRIDLHENPWHCNCQLENIRVLNNEGYLIFDPICRTPDNYNRITFSQFKTFCDGNESTIDNFINYKNKIDKIRQEKATKIQVETIDSIDFNKTCHSNNSYYRNIAPVIRYNCSHNRLMKIDFELMDYISKNAPIVSSDIQLSYFIYSQSISMVEITIESSTNYGLIWYQSACPNEIYCVPTVPDHLTIYNVQISTLYTICPVYSSGIIRTNTCIAFNPSMISEPQYIFRQLKISIFIMVIFFSGGLGAILLYGIIRKNPMLLKGSKRVLIVKGKTADALVLPPKVPLRNYSEGNVREAKDDRLLPTRPTLLNLMSRSSSVRSSKSTAPSYVSAIQPTEDQLTEWRLKQRFSNESIHPIDKIAWIYEGDSIYQSINSGSDNIYEIPKSF